MTLLNRGNPNPNQLHNQTRAQRQRVAAEKEKQGHRSMWRCLCRHMTLWPCFDVVPVVGLDLPCGAGHLGLRCAPGTSPSALGFESRLIKMQKKGPNGPFFLHGASGDTELFEKPSNINDFGLSDNFFSCIASSKIPFILGDCSGGRPFSMPIFKLYQKRWKIRCSFSCEPRSKSGMDVFPSGGYRRNTDGQITEN